MVNAQGRVHCSFVIGKSRVTPLKAVTVPRLELTAAVVSVKVSEQLCRELDMSTTQEFFWTDSQVVLGYIGNEVRRFHVFVANRVQQIQESSSVDQRMYVDTKQNPADEGSRGLQPNQLASSKWINGPDFLWKDKVDWVETRTMVERNSSSVRKRSRSERGRIPSYYSRSAVCNLAREIVFLLGLGTCEDGIGVVLSVHTLP